MMFSFASVAVALWLGIVAVACLHQVWRAVTNHPNLYGNRDYQRGTRGENNRDYRHLNPAAEGLIPIACRSVVHILRALTIVVRATFSCGVEWIRKTLGRSGTFHAPVNQSSALPVGISATGAEDRPAPVKAIPDGESAPLVRQSSVDSLSTMREHSATPNPRAPEEPIARIRRRRRIDAEHDARKAGTVKRKRTTQASKPTAETRWLSPPRNEKMTKLATETEVVASELAKVHSEKQNKKAPGGRTRQANKHTRTGRPKKRSTGSNVPLNSKISV